MKRAHLRHSALVLSVLVRIAIAFLIGAICWSMLSLLGSLGSRLTLIEQAGFVLVCVGLPGVTALVALGGALLRIRAFVGDPTLATGVRWAWTRDRIWRDTRLYPDGASPLSLYEERTATRRRGLILVRLDSTTRGTEQLWLDGDEADADAIRVALNDAPLHSSSDARPRAVVREP